MLMFFSTGQSERANILEIAAKMLAARLTIFCIIFNSWREAACQLSSSAADGVHVAYAKGEGCSEPCHPDLPVCIMKLDGVLYPRPSNGPSFYFAVFEFPSFKHKQTIGFQTFSSGKADLMTNWINNLADGSVVIGCSRDDVSTSMNSQAWLALQSIGMDITHTGYRSAHALIGYKGAWPKNMRKSKSVSKSAVEVTYTFVLPPLNINLYTIGNMLEVTWTRRGSQFQRYFINATNSFGTGEGDTGLDVQADVGSAMIGPLTKGAWFTITMQVQLSSSSDQVVIPSDPYFVIFKGITGCSTGIFQFLFKIDGNKQTFKHDEDLWTDNTEFLPETSKFTGFDGIEAKPKAYDDYKISRICAGMKDLQTGSYAFIEFNMTARKTMHQWMQDSAGFPSLPSSAWNMITPQGVPVAEDCYQGLKVNKDDKKSRLGFLGSSGGGGGCVSKDVVGGYGLKYKGGNYLSAGAIYESGGSKIFKKGFGYVLIPYLVDSQWNGWGSWQSCTRTCGTGTRTRTRNSTRAFGDGIQLPTSETSIQSCRIVDCPPPFPQNIIAEAKARDQIKLTWTQVPPEEMTGTFAYYRCERRKQGESTVVFSTSSNGQKTVYTLQPFTEYCFRVQTVLKSGVAGNFSSPVCKATEEAVPLAAPTEIKAVNSSSFCLNVTWIAIPANLARGVITKYRIYYKLQSSGATEQAVDSEPDQEHTVCGLEPYTEYVLKMSGFTSKGEGPVSSSYTPPVFTDEYIPSEAPAITSTQHTSSTSIVVTWSSLALSLWRGVPLGYRIFYVLHDIYAISGTFQNVSSVSVTHQLLTAQLTQLEKYKKYVIWLCAFTIKGNGVKNSSFAEQMTDEDIPIQGPPCKAYNTSAFSINAVWSPLETQYRLGQLTAYTVFYKNLKTGDEGYFTVESSMTSKEIKNLKPFQNHSFEIAASTSKGMGPRGPPAFCLTDEYVPRIGPPNFSGVNISSYDLQLNWSRIPNDGWQGVPLGYTILYRETNADVSTWNSSVVNDKNSLSNIIPNLTAYTNYTIRIAGFTIKGNGNFTKDIVVSTAEDAPYIAPGNLTLVVINETSCIIKWRKPLASKVKGVIRAYKVIYKTVYTASDFVSHLVVKKARRRRAVISEHLEMDQKNMTLGPDQLEVKLQNLQGYTNYSVQVLAVTLYDGPISDPIFIFTKETIPAMSPINVTASATTYTALMVKWKHLLPAYAHGAIAGYVVYYQNGNHSTANEFNETQVADNEFLEITHLKIFDWYTVQVAAFTSRGVGVRSLPVHARTGEYIPSKPPENVTALSFTHPFEINATWLPLPKELWNGVPLGYILVLTSHSISGVKLPQSQVISITRKVSPQTTHYNFRNLLPFYKYALKIRAFTIVGEGPDSKTTYVETCQIANARMRSSWYQYPPLVKRNALTPVPNGIIPKILSAALRHCSGRCIGLNVKGNATIDYTQDGLGKPSEKTNLDHLTSTMTVDTEFLFPVMKPEFSNDEYKFITLVSPSSAVVVEGKPLENLTGKNITSGISSLFTIMVVFVLFCFAAGCLIWIAETWYRTGQFRISSISGLLEGFYWGWVTATTVGYGDFTPVSVIGRLVSMVWSLMGLILCGFLSGSLTTFLTSSENPLAKATAPASGVGMVLDTWEFAVARKKGMSIDMNFTSYSDLLDAVGNATIRYGILDASVSTIWAAKLAKQDIKVKKQLPLGAELGIFATGNAKQMFQCFETYVKEEQSSILRQMQTVLETEAASVAKMLDVKGTVSIEVTPSKPEFYSWESQIMQSYVKLGGALFLALFFCGLIYEAIRRRRRFKQAQKTAAKQPRKVVAYSSDNCQENLDGSKEQLATKSTCFSEIQKSNASLRVTPQGETSFNSDTAADIEAQHGSSNTYLLSNDEKLSTEEREKSNETVKDGLSSRAGLSKQQENGSDGCHASVQDKEDSAKEETNGMEFETDCVLYRSQNFDNGIDHPLKLREKPSQSASESNSDELVLEESFPFFEDFAVEQKCNKMDTDSAIDSPRNISPVQDDEMILSFAGCIYHDNDLLERETKGLIQDLDDNFERIINELTEKHLQERYRLKCIKMEHDRKLFGGTYKYFDPYDFITDW